ncbi:hypothetical protein TB1_020710 [Malus domestica]
MVVVPREAEKLNLNNAGFLAQKHLARGLRLNRPKAAALIATQLLEIGLHISFSNRKQVLPGVQYLLECRYDAH